MLKRLLLVGMVAALVGVAPAHAAPEDPKNKGLYVTPVREYVAATPGTPQQKSITLANNTLAPLTIDLSVEQFSVTDYTYDFTFRELTEDWIKLSRSQVTLEPGKSTSVSYVVAPPQDAAPGGHYFTIFASATLQTGGVPSKVRAASTVYVTVQGELRLTTSVQKLELPRVAFGGDIGFSMDVKGTGNTHFFVYVAGELQGLTAPGKGPESTHLLMPGTVRSVGGTIPAPLLPGVYTAQVGYITDAGEAVRRSQKIIFIPPWSLFTMAGLVWIGIVVVQRYKRRLRRLRIPRDNGIGHS